MEREGVRARVAKHRPERDAFISLAEEKMVGKIFRAALYVQ